MSSASAVRLSPSVQKQKLKLELLRGSRLKLESLPVSVVVHEHLVRAGCMFFGTATRRTLTNTGTIGTASHSDISVHGFVTAQKEHVGPTLLSIYSYYLMDISCNTFGVATSPIVADLSTSFNGMSLNMWSCTSSSLILAPCSLDFRGALNEHY